MFWVYQQNSFLGIEGSKLTVERTREHSDQENLSMVFVPLSLVTHMAPNRCLVAVSGLTDYSWRDLGDVEFN